MIDFITPDHKDYLFMIKKGQLIFYVIFSNIRLIRKHIHVIATLSILIILNFYTLACK